METFLPFAGMVIVILAQSSCMVVNKATLSRGFNKYVILYYPSVLSSFILLILSSVFNRRTHLQLNFSIICRLLVLGLILCLVQISGMAGIEYGSPSLSTAMLNLIPAFTFILAVLSRMEKQDWRSRSSRAKTFGTLISISGAFVVTFYKGPMLIAPHTHLLLPSLSPWIIGALLLAAQAFLISSMYTLQAIVLKSFPAILTVQFYVTFSSTVLSIAYPLFFVRDASAWKIGLDMGLIAVLYNTLVGTVLQCTLCGYCLEKAGPFFVSMFKPLAIIFTGVMGVLFLGDALFLGSLIGVIIIVTGFYAVMWGKANEEERSRKESWVESYEPSNENVPLLRNKIEDARSFA